MDEKKFWQLTALIDCTAMEDGDGESAIAPLRLALSGLPIREIEAYEEFLAKKLYLIDGEVFADNAGESGHLRQRSGRPDIHASPRRELVRGTALCVFASLGCKNRARRR